MNVLIVGGGGREHAIALALRKNPKIGRMYCAPGNAGTAQIAENLAVAATDIPGMVRACREHAVDYVVVTPDDPLALGMTDALEEQGVRVFGPNKAAAVIEGSKVFAKELMKKYGIPTARYECFDRYEDAQAYVRGADFPLVVKADGLALGKGVTVAATLEEAENALQKIMVDKAFGDSGGKVVIEECLSGPEVSVLCFTDSHTIVPMASSMDHKRAYDGDRGPNTGGMGAVAPNPFYTEEIAERCKKEIFLPTVDAMNREERPFKGCLYFGLMLTEDGPKVIEYNCRFGDPETQAVLPLLESDLLTIMEAVTGERLAETEVRFSGNSCACVVMASGGYPGSYPKGREITGLDGPFEEGIRVYHAGTAPQDGITVTSGGRVLGISAVAESLPEALRRAYGAVGRVHFEGAQFRRDIGARAAAIKSGKTGT